MRAVVRFMRKKTCPTCGVVDFTRRPRTFWMRWFPGSRLYQCRHCRDYILLLGGADSEDEVTPEGV